MKFFRALKLRGKLFYLFFNSSFIQGCESNYSGVNLFSGLVIILLIISLAAGETPSNSGISKLYSPFFTAYKISASLF